MPQFIGTTVSALCSTLPRPLILTGAFREILSRHFATREHIEQSELAALIWQAGETTGILIEAIHRRIPELTEMRPAVIIKRNAMRNIRVGIADLNQGPPADPAGRPHYTTFWVGSHTLFCIARSGAQAELLATEVYRELHQFHPVIRELALLHKFYVAEVGAISELEEARESYVVPVTVSYAFQDMWTINEEVPVLRSIRLSSLTAC